MTPLRSSLPGHSVDILHCFERSVFRKVDRRADGLVDVFLQRGLHQNSSVRSDGVRRYKVGGQRVFFAVLRVLPVFSDKWMFDFEDIFGQRLTAANVIDVEDRLDTAGHTSHCGNASGGWDRKERYVAEPVFVDLLD